MLADFLMYRQAQLHHRLDNTVRAASLLLQLRDRLRAEEHPRVRKLSRALEREVVEKWEQLPLVAQESLRPMLPPSLARELPHESLSAAWSAAAGLSPCLLYEQQNQVGFVRTFCAQASPSDSEQAMKSRFERTIGGAMRGAIQQAGELAVNALRERLGFQERGEALENCCYLMNGRERNDWQHDGGSIGFSALLAISSGLLGLPLPADLVYTGAWDDNGRSLQVQGLLEKMQAVSEEMPWVTRLALPASMCTASASTEATQRGLRLCSISHVGELLDLAFEDRLKQVAAQVVDHSLLVQNAEIAMRRNPNYVQSLREFERIGALCVGPEEEPTLARCLWWQSSCHRHLGHNREAQERGEEAATLLARLYEEHRCVPEVYYRFLVSYGILFQVSFQYEEAQRQLELSRESLEQFRRSKEERARAHGALGTLLTFRGEYEDAEEHQQKAAAWTTPQERPRNLNNLADLYIRWGRERGEDSEYYRRARESLRESQAQWEQVYPLLGRQERLQHVWFRRVYEGKLACYSGAMQESREELEEWRGQWQHHDSGNLTLGYVDKWWGLALLRQGHEEMAEEWLHRALATFALQGTRAVGLAPICCSLELERALILWRSGRETESHGALQRALRYLEECPEMRNACPAAIGVLENEGMDVAALREWCLRLHY